MLDLSLEGVNLLSSGSDPLFSVHSCIEAWDKPRRKSDLKFLVSEFERGQEVKEDLDWIMDMRFQL